MPGAATTAPHRQRSLLSRPCHSEMLQRAPLALLSLDAPPRQHTQYERNETGCGILCRFELSFLRVQDLVRVAVSRCVRRNKLGRFEPVLEAWLKRQSLVHQKTDVMRLDDRLVMAGEKSLDRLLSSLLTVVDRRVEKGARILGQLVGRGQVVLRFYQPALDQTAPSLIHRGPGPAPRSRESARRARGGCAPPLPES